MTAPIFVGPAIFAAWKLVFTCDGDGGESGKEEIKGGREGGRKIRR
jgi:hypothetical protein